MFFPEYASRYPYSEDGKIRYANESHRPVHGTDPGGRAYGKIRPARHHLSRAPAPASVLREAGRGLDYLSGGRFELELAWLAEKFEGLGVPWPRRAARTEVPRGHADPGGRPRQLQR